MSDKTKTYIGLHTAVLLAGATGLFGRMISLSGLTMVWYRVMVSLVTMAGAMLLLGRLHKTPVRNIIPIMGCGCLLAFHWVAFFASIKASNVSVGVVCIATSCFFTLLFEPLINKKRVSVKEVLISFITIAGVLLIFSLDVRYRLGIALGLLSAAIYSIFAILNIRVAKSTGEDSSTMLLYELFGGVLILSVITPIYFAIDPSTPRVPLGSDLLGLILLGSIFTVIPFLLQIIALRNLSAFTVNVTYNLEPVYSIIFAAILFGETRELNASFWIGLTFVVVSVILQTINQSRSR